MSFSLLSGVFTTCLWSSEWFMGLEGTELYLNDPKRARANAQYLWTDEPPSCLTGPFVVVVGHVAAVNTLTPPLNDGKRFVHCSVVRAGRSNYREGVCGTFYSVFFESSLVWQGTWESKDPDPDPDSVSA